MQDKLGPSAIVVTVFPEDNKKYLSTDLMHEEPIQKDYIGPEVRLLGLTTTRRVSNILRGLNRRSDRAARVISRFPIHRT